MNPLQPTQTDPIGVSVKQAAVLTSLSHWFIRDEVNAGRIPARRVGSRIVIDYDGLRAWVKSQPFVAPDEAAS